MGSSEKTGKFCFRGSPEHFLDKNAIWDSTPPPPTHQLQSTCVEEGSRVPNLQTEFNYLDSFKSYDIFSDFVVPTWAPSSSRRPSHPHVVPTSSPHRPRHPCHPRHPHVVPISPRRSPCGLHGLWSPLSVVSIVCGLPGLWSPHVVPVVPVVPTSSPHHLEGLYIIPNPPDTHFTHPASPWGVGALNQ